jgi:hypothetical protein
MHAVGSQKLTAKEIDEIRSLIERKA